MTFIPDETQLALQDSVRRFVRDRIAPTVAEDDEGGVFRKELFREMGEMGFTALPTPEEYGGLGLGYVEYALVLEEIARVSPAYAVTVAVNGLPQIILVQFGNDEQRERYLPRLAAAEILGGFALSEPSCGSDAAALKTAAVRDGDAYVLNGSKAWATQGHAGDLFVIMARTGGEGAKGVSAFLVESAFDGVSFGKPEDKMGLRASHTSIINLDDVRVPVANRLGDEGQGFVVAMQALDSGRITIGATAVGLASEALDVSVAYSRDREAFGRPIGQHQGVGFLLADMAIEIEAARLLVLQAAGLKDAGRPYSAVAAMAKCKATDTAMRITTDAVQVLGG
ncbi:MAG: acyl-CoA dehydrogenase family protein, partial [Myxococcota bacterium]|nr:acyl-CoA dehydrogenase family protein [Myxococcota bacterium]